MTWTWPSRPRRGWSRAWAPVRRRQRRRVDLGRPRRGAVGIARVTLFDPSRLDSQVAAEVKDFDPSDVLDRKERRRTDRYIQFALVTARQALDSAGLPGRLDGDRAARTGVIVGSGLGGVSTLFENVLVMGERGPDRISPFFIPMGIANVGAGQVAIAVGATGPNFATVSACATGGHALGEAWETIRRGDADIMIAGGVEAGIHEATMGGFASMKALSTRNDDPAAASRPFDQGRDGFVIGEGGGVVILEALESAEARRATPLAELVGYGRRPMHRTSRFRHPGGSVRSAPRRARSTRRAWSRPRSITSTPTRPRPGRGQGGAPGHPHHLRRPRLEGCGDREQIDDRAYPGCRGRDRGDRHDHGAREGCVPPTINLDAPDAYGAGLDLTPNVATRRPLHAGMSNSFGFGGQNTALVFRRWTDDRLAGVPAGGANVRDERHRGAAARGPGRGRPG